MERNRQFDDRYLAFGAAVLRLLPQLPTNRVGAHVGDQLFRSATSVGAHLQEARAAESRADFIHKMQMALKEIREAKYWLSLIGAAEVLPTDVPHSLLKEAGELVAILSQSVITVKARSNGISNLKPNIANLKTL
jgi:four helix bundle protein